MCKVCGDTGNTVSNAVLVGELVCDRCWRWFSYECIK